MPSAGEYQDAPQSPKSGAAESWGAERYTDLIRRGTDEYGEAFLAYLILDGVEQRSRGLIEEFEAAFVNWYPDRGTFIDEQLGELGWNARLAEMIWETGIESGNLEWNDGALWDHLNRIYRTTERLEGVYVFRR